MSASPHGRCADRALRPLMIAAALLVATSHAVACDDDSVVEPESEPIQPKVDELKQNVESFEKKVEGTIEKRSADAGVSVDDTSD